MSDSDTSDIVHASDCAVHRAPAYEPGPCDCGATPAPLPEEVERLCDALRAVPGVRVS